MSDRPRDGGIFFGVLLVVIGAVTLLVRLVPGTDVSWWDLWPLVIVVAGVVQIFTPGRHGWGSQRVFDGAGTVIAGAILLGNTTGYISWAVWWTVVTLWPALLVALGLSLLSRGLDKGWLRIVATLVIWTALAFAVATSWSGATPSLSSGSQSRNAGTAFDFAEKESGATRATLVFKGGAGDIALGSGSELVSMKGSSPFGNPQMSVDRSGSSANVEFTMGEPNATIIVPGTRGSSAQVTLSDAALWDATFETGASTMDADFSDIRVRALELRTGASAVTMKVGPVPATERRSTLLVKAGASSVTLLLPRDAEARIETANGLVATDVGGRFEKRDGAWQTPGYSSADRVWDIKTQAGLGSFAVETY